MPLSSRVPEQRQAATPEVDNAEKNFLPQVDAWFGELFSPDNVEATCASIAESVFTDERPVVEIKAQEQKIAECRQKMNRYRAALEAGTDPAIVSQWIAETTAAQAAAEARLRVLNAELPTITPRDIEAVVRDAGELMGLLESARPELRAKFYEEIHLTGTFDPDNKWIDVTADLGARVRFVSAKGPQPYAHPSFDEYLWLIRELRGSSGKDLALHSVEVNRCLEVLSIAESACCNTNCLYA